MGYRLIAAANSKEGKMRTIGTNEPTRWEVMLEGHGQRYLVQYTSHNSGRGVRTAIRDRWDALERITGASNWQCIGKIGDGYVSKGWTVRLSGFTQRDRRSELNEELPFILDVVA